jgi:uncharacterized membrane protein YebE (DUF533 family)
MFDPKQLLDQVLGGVARGQGRPGVPDIGTGGGLGGGVSRADAGRPSGGLGGALGGLGNLGTQVKGGLDSLGGAGGFAGGAAVGGLLGMLLGGKKGRRAAGGMLGYGGAAAVGALALHAYQAYKRGQAVQSTVPMTVTEVQNTPQAALPHSAPAADGGAFELVLVRAMVGAAKADGSIDADEQRKLFSEVERMGLDAESKAYVFDLLTKPVDLDGIVNCVATQEQGAELYLASRLAIDPDEASERVYLDALASRLKLPAELRAHLDKEAAVAGAGAAGAGG